METNEELNEVELIEKHKRIVTILCRKFARCGLNEQDLFQEGMIALFRAIKTFKADGGAKFETYASRCIRNRFIDLARKEQTKSTDTRTIADNDTSGLSLEDEIDLIEKNDTIRRILDDCTDIERAIFNSYYQGFSYEEMSKIFEVSRKKIDNTIQKIRNRIKNEMK